MEAAQFLVIKQEPVQIPHTPAPPPQEISRTPSSPVVNLQFSNSKDNITNPKLTANSNFISYSKDKGSSSCSVKSNEGVITGSPNQASPLSSSAKETRKKLCSGCKTVCGIACFIHDQHELTLCARCYVRGNYRVGVRATEFRRVEISEAIETSDWTEKETLHLFEAVQRCGDWKKVAEHVGGRSEKECVARFLKLPFKEQFVGPAEVDKYCETKGQNVTESGTDNVSSSSPAKKRRLTPLADASNPIMVQVPRRTPVGTDLGPSGTPDINPALQFPVEMAPIKGFVCVHGFYVPPAMADAYALVVRDHGHMVPASLGAKIANFMTQELLAVLEGVNNAREHVPSTEDVASWESTVGTAMALECRVGWLKKELEMLKVQHSALVLLPNEIAELESSIAQRETTLKAEKVALAEMAMEVSRREHKVKAGLEDLEKVKQLLLKKQCELARLQAIQRKTD